ncbi:MAG: hypothetical protein ACE5QF_00120 [Thermoplasmata archaeon]
MLRALPLIEASLILTLCGWTIHSLAASFDSEFVPPAMAITVLAASLALFGLVTDRNSVETTSLSLIAAVFLMQNVFILPKPPTMLFSFVTIAIYVFLLARQRTFFREIIESMKGDAEMLSESSSVLRSSFARLTLAGASAYFLSILLYTVAVQSTLGATSIWSAVFFSILFLISLLFLSIFPR